MSSGKILDVAIFIIEVYTARAQRVLKVRCMDG